MLKAVLRTLTIFAGICCFMLTITRHHIPDILCSRVLLNDGCVHNKTWTPDKHCVLHNYTTSEIKHILSSRGRLGSADVWFAGDSRVRRLGDVFAALLKNEKHVTLPARHNNFKHIVKNISHNMTIEFIWSPFLYVHERHGGSSIAKKLSSILTSARSDSPSFVFLSSCVWYMFRHAEDFIKRFTDTLLSLHPVIRNVSCSTETRVVWVLNDRVYPEHWNVKKNVKDVFTSANIRRMNEVAEHTLKGSGVYIWRSAHVVSDMIGQNDETNSPSHVSLYAIQRKAQILLNIYAQEFTRPWPKENNNATCHGNLH